jgi:uncharacterized protein YndB with AHSA1/START domain
VKEKIMAQSTARREAPQAALREFVISRTFDAPRAKVWRAFAEFEQMKQWFAPKGFKVKSAKMDFRSGGTYHYCLSPADGTEMWGKAVYREIAAPERLVWVNSFSDEQAGLSRHPMAPTWPLEMLTTVTLAEQGGKTTVTVRWLPLNPSDEERATFDAGHESMKQGWTGTFDQLEEHLAKS